MNDREFAQSCTHSQESRRELLQRYSRLIYSSIIHILRLKGRPTTDELVTEIFHQMVVVLFEDDCRRLRSYQGRNGCSLATWLRQVCINATLDYLRVGQQATVSLDAPLTGSDEQTLTAGDLLADTRPKASDEAMKSENLGYLAECVAELCQDDHYFLELHLNQQLELELVAGHLGISRGAADMRKLRIMERLRDCFRRKGALVA